MGNLWSFEGLMGGAETVRKTRTITSRAARNWGNMGGELERDLGGVWGVGSGKEQEGRLGKREEGLQRPGGMSTS